ncbi:MAG TPA: thermonuclease family protein [Candidatus Wallbacteria bacterium]|nr:thermonuclease family protein [Candidatus Wallbacteria bacterium]
MSLEKLYIEKVVDGDTLNASSGRLLRLIGIDCPDFRLPYYDEVLNFVKEAIEEREILVEYCPVKKLDTYNRERVIIFYKDKRGHNYNLNLRLLKLGYARLFAVPPCHIDFYEWARIEYNARQKKLGIWSCENDDSIISNYTQNSADEEKDLGNTKISNKLFKLGYFWSLSDASKVIYMLLCHMAHPTGVVWIAFTTIVKNTRYDLNTVLMCLNEMDSMGLISYKISQSKEKPNYIILHKIIPPPKKDPSARENQVDTLDLF